MHLRFFKTNSKTISHTFNPPKSKDSWFLESASGNVYKAKALKNIKVNNTIKIEELGEKAEYLSAFSDNGKPNTFFRCEIHFEQLPKKLKKVSLIEGDGYTFNQNKLNCMDIEIYSDPNRKDIVKKITPKIPGEIEDLKKYKGKATIDEHPVYKAKNNPKDMTDKHLYKVVYTETETIFFLQLYLTSGSSTFANFYPVGTKDSWFLKNTKGKEIFKLKAVTNIRQDNELKCKKLGDKVKRLDCKKYTTNKYTCQVHFERLPKEIKKVHLIEGTNRKKQKGYNFFDYFNIELLEIQ